MSELILALPLPRFLFLGSRFSLSTSILNTYSVLDTPFLALISQGVLEWRNWMEAMGPLIAANEKRSIAETKKDYIEVDEEVVVEEDELRDMEVDEIISDTIITSPANSSGKMTAAAGTVPPSSSNRTILDASLSEFAWLSTKRADLESLGIEVPDGWEWGSNWFEIAKALPHEDAEYLRELPLTIRVDELNAFIVHAGLRKLPSWTVWSFLCCLMKC